MNKIAGKKIDIEKLINKLCGDMKLFRAYYYNCPPYQPPVPSQEDKKKMANALKFYTRLERIQRLCVRKGKLKFRGCNNSTGSPIFEQKRVDLMIGLDVSMLTQTHPRVVDVLVLLTGDGDLLPALIAARDAGIIVSLAHEPSRSYDNEIWENADERIDMDSSFFEAVKYEG